MPYTYDHPRPAVSVDVVLLRRGEAPGGPSTEVLLVERGRDPFRGAWALPGGFVGIDEDLRDAAERELLEETGIETNELTQLGAFGRPGRDPRGHTVSVVYLGRVCRTRGEPVAGDDAADAKWFALSDLPELAFDHAEIIAEARRRAEDEAGAPPA